METAVLFRHEIVATRWGFYDHDDGLGRLSRANCSWILRHTLQVWQT